MKLLRSTVFMGTFFISRPNLILRGKRATVTFAGVPAVDLSNLRSSGGTFAFLEVVVAVYFIQQADGDQLIKIGKANDVRARMKSIKNETKQRNLKLLGIIAGDEREEGILHAVFADYRRHGEWFEPCPFLLRFINQYASLKTANLHIRGGGRPRNKVKTITYKLTLCLREGVDDDLISWLQSLPPRGMAQAVVERSLKGLENMKNQRNLEQPNETTNES